jgi:hypothetical protein
MDQMGATIHEHPKASDNPRVAFVHAWERWTRETAQGLIAAKTMDEMTPWLAELVVCNRVMATLVGAAVENDEHDDGGV